MRAGWRAVLLLPGALAACSDSGLEEHLDAAVEREVARAAEHATKGLVVDPTDDERWLPQTALPRFHQLSRADVAALEAYAISCGAPPGPYAGPLQKALAWAQYRCGRTPLPADFFAKPPFMHPDGWSFAWHARDCTAPECRPARDAAYHHVLERAEVDPAHWPPLDRAALARLRAGEPFANVGTTLLVRHERAYAAIPIASIAAANSRIGVGSSDACDARAFGQCWVDLGRRRSASRARRAGFVALAASAAALLALLAWRIRLGRRFANERAFVLRLLAHELRTPVTALKLEVERLRDGFDALPPPAQDHFLAMARDVARLQRVVEASAIYLRSDAAAREAPQEVESLRSFVEAAVAEATTEPIAIDAPDVRVELPVRSTALVLRNLLRNAAQHGKAPYAVKATVEPSELQFEVQDAGELADSVVAKLGRPFVNATASGGLGLGLYLANQVLASLGSRMRVSQRPTSFSFSISSRGAAS